MNNSTEITFVLDSRAALDAALGALQDRFRICRDHPWTTRQTYLDTFDWRLYRYGGTLAATALDEGFLLEWRSLHGALRRRSRIASLPEFAADLPTAFHDDLATVIDVRRLLPIVHEELQGETVSVLDRREKTVARVRVQRGVAILPARGSKPCPLPDRLRVCEVLGYPKSLNAVVRVLGEQEAVHRQEVTVLEGVLAAVGRQPCSYSSKLNLHLARTTRADAAARTILRVLIETMRANENGTRRNLDIEFLHDFRVAVRRTRSCLGQLKGLFDDAVTRPFRKEFAWLGGISGPTRDLDVYLLNMKTYLQDVPESMRVDLGPLEQYLIERHRTEQRRLARTLDSKRYRALMSGWSRFLDTPVANDENPAAPDASRPIVEVASEQIWRAYRKVRRRGREIDESTPQGPIHRLRIDCKKLRYLLEFFRSLYDAAAVAGLVRSLKRLQDVLGDFNDVGIQLTDLRAIAAEMLKQDGATADSQLAMGCLLGRLDERERSLRTGLTGRVHQFVSDDVRKTVRKLLR